MFDIAKKCFTKVVELGLNNSKVATADWSLSLPTSILLKGKKPVPCAKSDPVLYPNPLSLSFSMLYALKFVVVFATL